MNRPTRRSWLVLGFLILSAAGLYGFIPQLANFAASWQALRHASDSDLLLGFSAVLASYVLSAATYYVLALRPLRYGQTLLIELAGLLVNRILPAGIGGLGLNFAYLRRRKHSAVEATAVVSLNNLLGFVGHGLLAATLLLLMPAAVHQFHFSHKLLLVVASMLGGLLLVAVAGRYYASRHRLSKKQSGLKRQIAMTLNLYRHRPSRLVAALILSIGLTLANVLCLWLCGRSIGLRVGFIAMFIVFTFGIAAGTAAPTPGGLGAVEAGIIGGLVALRVPVAQALAVALVYRLVSFWLGLLIGAVALLTVRR